MCRKQTTEFAFCVIDWNVKRLGANVKFDLSKRQWWEYTTHNLHETKNNKIDTQIDVYVPWCLIIDYMQERNRRCHRC